MAENKRGIPLYRKSFYEAEEDSETGIWRENHELNIECRDTIEQMIEENFHENHLDGSIAEKVSEIYGTERVGWVLANTVLLKSWDGRFRPHNRKWAEHFGIHADREEPRREYCVNSHPELVNGIIDQYRRYTDMLGLLSEKSCAADSSGEDYRERLLILRPSALSGERLKGEFQYFYAESGSGCDPENPDSEIYGEFLAGGEQDCFRRSDFIGIADETMLPEWAAEKLGFIAGAPRYDDGMTMQ